MIRKLIRNGRENNIAEIDLKAIANISAHSGVNTEFASKSSDEITFDGAFIQSKNLILINPKASKSI